MRKVLIIFSCGKIARKEYADESSDRLNTNDIEDFENAMDDENSFLRR